LRQSRIAPAPIHLLDAFRRPEVAPALLRESIGRAPSEPEVHLPPRSRIRCRPVELRPLSWVNDLLAVATGERRRATVRIDVHEVV